jgi:hypothetical protein
MDSQKKLAALLPDCLQPISDFGPAVFWTFIEKWFSTTLFAQQRISWAHYTLPFEDLPLTGTASIFVPDSDARDILRDIRDRTFRDIYNQKIADNL